MKKLFNTYLISKKELPAQPSPHYSGSMLSLFLPMALFVFMLLSACSKQQTDTPAQVVVAAPADTPVMNSDDDFMSAYKNLDNTAGTESRIIPACSFITFLELLKARAATAKYRQFSRAIEDGYADINVVVPNMGYHYMKSSLADATFDIRKPEILVYNKKINGSFELVAVEYAVPISLTPYTAPEGFTGSGDVWERNTDFGLWLLHAWVWQFNPDGVFHDTNPQVHLR